MNDPFVKAVEAIYDAAAAPTHWPAALQAIADCSGDVGAVLIWQRDDGGFGTIVPPSLQAAQDDYQSGWWRQDIRAARAVEYGYRHNAGAITDRHLITDEEIANHPIYAQFLASHGLRWVASIQISPDPHISVAISVQRASVKDPFSDSELEALTRLGDHAEKSLRLSMRLLDAELRNLGLGQALARVGIGVFALDSDGRVVFSNPAGERLLGPHVAIVNGRLRIGSGAQSSAVDLALRQVLQGGPSNFLAKPEPILIERAESDRPLALYLLPLVPNPGGEEQFLTRTCAIVLLIDPVTDGAPDPAVVRDVLHLTLGEARVAALVGSGMSPRQASEKLGVAEETVRSVLKRVFSKVGVSRQSELTVLLTKLVLR